MPHCRIQAAPAAYLAATLRPQLPQLLINHFDPQPGEEVKLAEKNWPYPKPYDKLYSNCAQQMRDRIAEGPFGEMLFVPLV